MLCKSGRHDWREPLDAAKCCAGWRRVLAVAVAAGGAVVYSYTWELLPADVDRESGSRIAHDLQERA